jgi:hypothetical protein
MASPAADLVAVRMRIITIRVLSSYHSNVSMPCPWSLGRPHYSLLFLTFNKVWINATSPHQYQSIIVFE